MKLIVSNTVIFGLTLASFISSLLFMPFMPGKMASHWNVHGEVDGYMNKFWGLFLIPFLFIALGLMFYLIPRIDPLKSNIKKFKKYYKGFVIVIFGFLLVVHLQVLLWNAGLKISPNAYLPVLFFFLLYYLGLLLENAKRNWFIGIRTPWTLSSDSVWDKTHRLGGKLFKICAFFSLLGVLFQAKVIFFLVVPLLFSVVFLVVYSYFEFQKITAGE